MPLKNWNTQADWDAAYDLSGEHDGYPSTRPEVRLGYCRSAMLPYARVTAQSLAKVLNWTPETRIVIVGAGFGWTAEILQNEMGYTHVAAVDVSSFIHSNKALSDSEEIQKRIRDAGLDPQTGRGAELFSRHSDGGPRSRVTIHNEDLATGQSRGRILQSLGGLSPEWCLTESMLESLTDGECRAMSTRIHVFSGNVKVAHLLTTSTMGLPAHDGWNTKTLQEWKSLLPLDTIVETGTFAVL